MKLKVLSAIALFVTCLSTQVLASGNIQLIVQDLSKISYGSLERKYWVLNVSGNLSQSDAFVKDLPSPLPQNISLIAENETQRELLKICTEMAMTAKKEKGIFYVEIRMNDPQNLLKKIMGGMRESQFNTFFLDFNDEDFGSIVCSIR